MHSEAVEAACAALEADTIDAGKAAPRLDLFDNMMNSTVRFGAVWPFPIGPLSEELIEAVAMRIDGNLPPELAGLIANWSEDELDALADEDVLAFEMLEESAYNKGVVGWFGVAETPVMTRYGEGPSMSYSWGHYYTELLFAPTADALLEKAVAWADAKREEVLHNG